MLKYLLLVGLGGFIGSGLRYLTSVVIKSPLFPLATLLVNCIGSLLIGLVMGYALKHQSFEQNWRLFLATGVCGGFTTFSAFSIECVQLIQQQRYQTFILYMSLSIIVSLSATFAGLWFTR
jgi:CrcB protein